MSSTLSEIKDRVERRVDDLLVPRLIEKLCKKHSGRGLRDCGCSFCLLKRKLTMYMSGEGKRAARDYFVMKRRTYIGPGALGGSHKSVSVFDPDEYEVWKYIYEARRDLAKTIRKELDEEKKRVL